MEGTARKMDNLFRDALTGLPNMFGLLECDMEKTFGESGTILFLDLNKLTMINDQHGHAVGDQYIMHLANLIRSEISEKYSDVPLFKDGGDSFIIRFVQVEESLIRDIAERMNASLIQYMKPYAPIETGLRYAVWHYDEKIARASDLLQQSNISMFESIKQVKIDPTLPDWATYMVNTLFDRIQKTLDLLEYNHALAHRDDISGLPNHRSAELRLQQEITHYRTSGKPFSVLFIDGDNLKRYNELGYQYGNEMIAGLSRIMTGVLRESDRIFRWLSGDEFLVVLEGAGPKKATEIAERIRSEVESATLSWHFPVTISIGVANCPLDGETVDSIVDRAEKANTMAKHAGKNQVFRYQAI